MNDKVFLWHRWNVCTKTSPFDAYKKRLNNSVVTEKGRQSVQGWYGFALM